MTEGTTQSMMESDWEPAGSLDALILPRRFLRMCRQQMRMPKVADSTGMELTGAGLLARTLLVQRLLRRRLLASDEQQVGVLLPPSVGGVVVNAALALDRRVAVNLNYTLSPEVMDDCVAQCGIRHVLTSHRVVERLGLKLQARMVYLEDLLAQSTWTDKLRAAAAAWFAPIPWLERRLRLTEVRDDDLMTVIFTSGSTGRPKGVMLTHRNIGSNVAGINTIIHLRESDVLLGILPLFHSFGYTTTMWTALTLPPKGIYHFTPLEAREIGKLAHKHGATILIAAPTFVRNYLRRCDPTDFSKLEVIVTGAERLPTELADAFEQKFGVRPMEGYGTTELSPVVSANIPPSRARDHEKGDKPGTIGRPMPGIAAKIVDLDTGADLGPNESGMLLVSGPNVMKGYFGRPDLTAEVIREEIPGSHAPRGNPPQPTLRVDRGEASAESGRAGSAPSARWYITGDVAMIDEEGFITITGRISRFSKLAGEMVPHIRVEEAIAQVLNLDDEDLRVAVTSVPDPKKGERLVVLHTDLPQTPEQICRALAAGILPPLWIPSPDSFRRVEAIPVLGTGKLDLKQLKELAMVEFLATA
jgi:acyl-[acyl-carrier-protein]-phospholipid O-acyltransferase / long-chain-fatty-acid--[acyl-carrier-protein] ligase